MVDAHTQKSWEVFEDRELRKEFAFKDFSEAMDFANKIAAIAEEENHHPDLLVSWGKVAVTLTTHSVGAVGVLTDKDFLVAKRIDTI